MLRRPEIAAVLLGALDGVDRLVLLGDVLELRGVPVREALAAARPLFEQLGASGCRVLLVPGNHDYALIAPWLERRQEPLGLEQRIAPAAASDLAATLAGYLGAGSLELAYPGVWLRDDVYATHGHYLDCHTTVPSLERIAIGAMGRVVGAGAGGAARPEDYEALLAPIYAWIHSVAQRGGARGAFDGGGSVRAWRALAGSGRRRARARLLAAGFPVVLAGLNRAGLGPLRSELAGPDLRRAALLAMRAVIEHLGIDAPHVVFGHTHRAGALAGDEPDEWLGLHNSGCWVFEDHFMTASVGESPYWPGACIALDESEPPRLVRLLGDRPHAELRPVQA